MVLPAVAHQFTATGEEDKVVGAVPMFDDVQALVDLAAQLLAVKVPAQEDRFDRFAQFGERFVGGMLNVVPGKTSQDRFRLGVVGASVQDSTMVST